MTYFIILTIDSWYLWFMSADLHSVVCFLGMFFPLNPLRGTTSQICEDVLFEEVDVN